MTISIELERGAHGLVASVSHECIYQAVYAHGRPGLPAGKSTDLSVYTPASLRAIEHRLNTMPRRSLGWDTATNPPTR